MQTKKLAVILVFFLFLSLFPLVYASTIFEDDFEVGNGYTNWTGTTVSAGTIAINQTVVHCNENSSKTFTDASGEIAYVYKTLSGSPTETYARFYIQLDADVDNNQRIELGKYRYQTAFVDVMRLFYRKSASTKQWYIEYRSAGSTSSSTSTTNIPALNTWVCIEMHYLCSTADGNTDGGYDVWVDGTQIFDFNNIDTDYTVIERFGVGSVSTSVTTALSVFTDCISIQTTYVGPESAGKNESFNLAEVPVVTATLNKGIELFQAVSGAPAFTSSLTYGLEWLFNLSEIPVQTATLVYGKSLALSFSEIPKIIADLVAEKGKNAIFDLSIIPAFITDLGKNLELKRSLSEVPKVTADLVREIELAFVEFVLLEVPIFTATLGFLAETGMSTGDLANGAIALALIALIFALCGIGLAVKKTSD